MDRREAPQEGGCRLLQKVILSHLLPLLESAENKGYALAVRVRPQRDGCSADVADGQSVVRRETVMLGEAVFPIVLSGKKKADFQPSLHRCPRLLD